MIRLPLGLSLRWKIPLRVMGAVLGTALAITLGFLVRDYQNMRASVLAHAKGLGQVMASTLVAPLLHEDIWRAYEIIRSGQVGTAVAHEFEAESVFVLDPQFKVLVSTQPHLLPIGSDPAGDPAVSALVSRLREGRSPDQIVFAAPSYGRDFVATPVVADSVILGHVVLSYRRQTLVPRFYGLVNQALWVLVALLLLIAPISWIWARRTGAPLLVLAEAMRHVPDHLAAAETAPLPETRDEIGQLSESFRRMLKELKKKQELEQQILTAERLAAVGRLAAGIAHEINNPLAGMLTAIKTFQRHGSSDPMAHQTLSLLERGLLQIKNTVSALLVETKMQDRPFEPADLDDLLILVEGRAQAKQLAIHCEGGIDEPLPLPATLIRQILLNLLLNAIAAADPQGMVKLELAARDGYLRISVCNDGQSIPEEQMNYLFEPFTSASSRGYGLGLWVVYQIVKQLNGGLNVTSAPGCTTFALEIPYEQTL